MNDAATPIEDDMDDPGPVRGPDITEPMQDGRSFGITAAEAADGIHTVEFTTDPAVHGPHGLVVVRHTGVSGRPLTADVQWPGRGRAACASNDSIRVWGRFDPNADVTVMSHGPVRLVVRSPAGAVLAGPISIAADAPDVELTW